MRHVLPLVLVLLSAAPLGAQDDRFIAPSHNNIVGTAEVSPGQSQETLFYVANHSTVPIVVYGFTLTSCENVKQWCGGQRVNVSIDPGGRRVIGRVAPKSDMMPMSYRWSYAWRADSSDAKMAELLRRNGALAETTPRVIEGAPRPVYTRMIDTSSPPGIEQPLSREPLTAEERSGGVTVGAEPAAAAPVAFRFKVFYGSVLGSTMMPGAPVQPTGPCINPAESAKYEKDARIARTPWRPPVVASGMSRIAMPLALRDSVVPAGDVLVRFVADTTGETIPGSVNVLESPHGLISVRACTMAIGGRSTPARDRSGKAIRAWVQMPVKVEIPAPVVR